MSANAPRPPKDPLQILDTVVAEKYQVLSLAGEGGFSLVYKARHLIWQQLVAIKFFVILEEAKPEIRDQLLEDFIREGKLMSELSSRSSSIVQARDIGKLQRAEGWIPYMVLEWLDGAGLDAVLAGEYRARTTPRTLNEAMALLEPVAAALDLAHRSNIAHRDLKPANIMLVGQATENDRSCKLLDFGIAKVMGEQIEHQQQLELTGQQITAFTPNYGAPEQFSRQNGATGPWTDVFAMALILVEMLRGGARALEGVSFFELGVASSHPKRPTPASFGIPVSENVEAVFAKALAVNPAERHGSMGEFWVDLHQHVFPESNAWQSRGSQSSDSRTSPQRPPFPSLSPLSIPRRLQPGHSQPPPLTAASEPRTSPSELDGIAPRPKRRNAALPAIIGVAAAAIVAATVFTIQRAGAPAAAPLTPAASATTSAPATGSAATSAPLAHDGPCPKKMKPVNGGTFTMGSDDKSFPLWVPAHKVTLDTFCLDENEVTVADYRACVQSSGCKPADTRPTFPKGESESDVDHAKVIESATEFCNWNAPGRETHPINCLDWYRADAYCRAMGFQLPTEAQWELAARGTDGRKFPWGDDAGDQSYMNAAGTEWRDWLSSKGLPAPTGLMYEKSDGFAGTAPVGRFPRAQTQSGQLDMVGNVWEWTRDWYSLYSKEAQTNPKGPGAGDRKAIRGGGFNGEFATWVNPAARYHQLATASAHVIGFRCSAEVNPAR